MLETLIGPVIESPSGSTGDGFEHRTTTGSRIDEMYGMVNNALEGMVVSRYGEETWERIKERAGVDVDVFMSNEGYPDDLTYKLVGAASEHLGISAAKVLEDFGVHWVVRTAREGYSELMDAGGRNLREFLLNLQQFHSRVSLVFPDLRPPRFLCNETGENSILVKYSSDRKGLAPFVVGLLKGLGERFKTSVTIRHILVRDEGAGHDEFEVSWPKHLTE